jgi:hypothetical protein
MQPPSPHLSTCHWNCPAGQVPLRTQRSCTDRRHGTLALRHPRLAMLVLDPSGCSGYSTCSKARRLLTRSASPGRTSLRSPIPFCRGLANLIKADYCSYLGPGVNGSGHSLFSRLSAQLPLALDTLLCKQASSLRSVDPRRFQKADLTACVRRNPEPSAICTTNGPAYDFIAARPDWAHAHG